jgi:hypothetical protein
MARDDWRLRIEFGDGEAHGLLGRLGLWGSEARELAHELADHRLAVTEDDGTVFVYASSSLELEQARKAIDEELRELETPPDSVVTEHWLEAEERWDDDAATADPDAEVLARGYAPWEVRIPARDHHAARELADRLEGEGYGVVRRWSFVIAGCASEEQARELAARLHGEVEPGGELVWEAMPGNPFAIFGGIGDSGGPI